MQVIDARTDGFDFLGYHFEGGTRRPREKSLAKLKETIRAKTRRTNGDSLATVIRSLNRMLSGWFESFKHSHRRTFGRIDGLIRRGLRSLLSHCAGRRRHGDGLAHIRWPTAFFTNAGLFSLARAHTLARQSSLRLDHRSESRMREIRSYGSEGGGAEANRLSLPLSSGTLPRPLPIGLAGRRATRSVEDGIPTRAAHRSTHRFSGFLDSELSCCSDWRMRIRSVLSPAGTRGDFRLHPRMAHATLDPTRTPHRETGR